MSLALSLRQPGWREKLRFQMSGQACAIIALVCGQTAFAGETLVYKYDALGRLIEVGRSGSVNTGTVSAIEYDKAGNRTRYAVTGVSSQVIYKQSFEGGLPSIVQKNDGGTAHPQSIAISPYHGSSAMRVGMVGSHVFALATPIFVATGTSVTLSFYFRDSDVTNQSLTGWSGSTVDGAAPVLGGVYNAGTGSWALDGWGNWSQVPMVYAPAGGGWTRYVRSFGGLQVGQTYAVTLFVDPYYGSRAVDVDALQIEYGQSPSAF